MCCDPDPFGEELHASRGDGICGAAAVDDIRGDPLSLAGLAGCFVFRPKRDRRGGGHDALRSLNQRANAVGPHKGATTNLDRSQTAFADQLV